MKYPPEFLDYVQPRPIRWRQWGAADEFRADLKEWWREQNSIMHQTLGSREPWSAFFRQRMIYSEEEGNKSLGLVAAAGKIVGVATLLASAAYTVKYARNLKGQSTTNKITKTFGAAVDSLGVAIGVMTVSYQVVNLIDHKIVPFISEMFFTTNANDQVKQMKQQVVCSEQLSLFAELGCELNVINPIKVADKDQRAKESPLLAQRSNIDSLSV